jgi:hypothetical protein
MLVPFDEQGDPFAAVDPHAAATAAVRRGCVWMRLCFVLTSSAAQEMALDAAGGTLFVEEGGGGKKAKARAPAKPRAAKK